MSPENHDASTEGDASSSLDGEVDASTRDTKADDKDGASDVKTEVDAAIADAASPAFDGGASCSVLPVSSVLVTPTCMVANFPEASGGVIVAGLYELESVVEQREKGCQGFTSDRERGTLEIVDQGTYYVFHEFLLFPDRTTPPLGRRDDWEMKPTKASPTLLGRWGEVPCTVGGLRGFDTYSVFTGGDGRLRLMWSSGRTFVKVK